MCRNCDVETIFLLSGLLTGKFKKGEDVNPNTRVGWATRMNFDQHASPSWTKYKDNEQYWKIIEVLQDLAKSKGKFLLI